MRKFSFLLQVDGNDKYQIANCEPALDAVLLIETAKVLNETEDMSYLVRSMRKLRRHVSMMPHFSNSQFLAFSTVCRTSLRELSLDADISYSIHDYGAKETGRIG